MDLPGVATSGCQIGRNVYQCDVRPNAWIMEQPPVRYDIKHSIPLFRDLSGFDGAEVDGMCQVLQIRPKDVILNRDDQTSDVFFILSGTVAVCDYSRDGKEIAYSEIGEGGIFGEFAAIDGAPRSASVEAKTAAVIAHMSAEDFRSLIAADGAFALRVSEHLVAKIRALSQRVFEFGALSVRQRLHAEILRMCDAEADGGDACTLSPAPSHYELATRIATHREAVTKELNRLVALGIARLERRSITITDVPRLRRAVSENGRA